MGCLWSPATNPTQLNNPATLRVCEMVTSARGAEIELPHNDDVGKTTDDRHQRGSVGSGEERVRAICEGGRGDGSRNWPRRREKPATMGSKRSAGNFRNVWRPN